MHRINGGRRKKWITASLAGVLTVAIVGTALYKDSSIALARPSLPGIEEIVNGNSTNQPFKILEIVDQYDSARTGYTVAGEEPGNDQAQALSDMASYGERYNNYMVPGVTNKNSLSFGAYTELKDKAFTYDETVAFDWGDNPATDPSTAYKADTPNVKTGKSYGTFEKNASTTGKYDPADVSGDYKLVNDGTTATDGNATIDDIYQKLPNTDQTGVFYMNYGGLVKADPLDPSDPDYTTLSGRRYFIKQYDVITSANAWQFPFKLENRDYQPDITTAYQWYDDNRYVANERFEANLDEHDVTDSSDDTYEFTSTVIPANGDVVFTDDGDDKLVFYGYVDGTNFRFDTNNDGIPDDMMPLTDGVTDQDEYGNPVVDADGNPVYSAKKSFAHTVYENSITKYVTVRTANSGDGAAVTKYYISGIVQDADGIYDFLTANFSAVNDPNFLPEEYGIVEETDQVGTGNPWYHEWYYKSQTTSPYQYVGTSGHYDFVHDFTAEVVDTYYYLGGYNNNEWFKREVLDVDAADCPNICIDVITKKLADVTPEDIGSANLIYFTGAGAYDSDSSGVKDLPYETAAALITAVDNEHKPVIIDLSATNAGTIFNIPTNFKNTVLLMLQSDIDGISQCVGATGWDISTDKSNALTQLGLSYYGNASTTGSDVSHVAGSVFVNDNLGTRTAAIAADFATAYDATKVNGFTLDGATYSFKEVQKDIDEEKFYLDVAGKDVSTFNDKISKATSIRYILNYGDRRVVGKTAIRVLDLEPYYSRDVEGIVEDYKDVDDLKKVLRVDSQGNRSNVTVENIAEIRDIFAKKWFKNNVSDTTENIVVTGMGTKEFIGRIEDLNESYDLIYIGMDTAYLNTAITRENNKYYKSKNVVGNDGKSYVYRHNGDYITTNGQTGGDGTWNLGGNDITPDKFRELQNYVKAGYAVLLSDEFFIYKADGSIDKIDDSRIEEESYLYDFIEWCISKEDGKYNYLYKNVDITKNFETTGTSTVAAATTDGQAPLVHRENFIKYVNISKLQVEVKEQPPLYNPYDTNDSNKHYYLAMNNLGQYALEYTVKLTNDAAVDTTKTDYDCQLYIDHDGDGRFETVERLDSLDITNEDNNDYINPDSSGKYHLTTGTTYKIYRTVPEGYVGLVPWKLVFIENRDGDANSLIKTAVQDYSAIADMTNKPTIKILQITSGNSDSTNLNLWNDTRLKELYTQVVDFNIKVDHCKSSDFMNRTGTIFGGGVDRLEKMYEYDMLVLGFLDMYSLTGTNTATSKEGILCIREYMLSGRSVLFTHDLTSTRIRNDDGNDWGELANRYLRDIQGMDRYGYIKNNVANLTFSNGQALSEYRSVYDERVPEGFNTVGFSDANLMRRNNINYGEIAAQNTRNTSNSSNGSDQYMANEREGYTVSRVNRGQITEYPFRIGSLEQSNIANGDTNYYANPYITVAKTHHQYFQLDMETNYLDENYDDDIVVWYALSLPGNAKSKYLKLNYNDVRNNFYIYNKGNITYTGAGHSNIEGDVEKKLFVNTLVAAYNAGTHAPFASYKNNDTRMATDITSTYIPYDIAFSQPVADGGEGDGWLQNTVTVYFKTVNNNLQDNLKPLVAQYYVEVPAGGPGILTIGTKHYKAVTPVAGSVKECVISNSGTTYNDVSDPQVLTNGRVYKMEFAISDLMNGNLQGVNTRYHAVIYTRMRTQTKGKTVDDDKTDLAATGTFTSLPANDSMKPLNVNFTQLYDLK